MNEAQQYALALLTEECGETLQTIGKAGRFGIDTPGVKHPYTGIVDLTITPRTELEKELGDLMAAIDYAAAAGIVSASAVQSRRATKFEKLVNPESLDFDMTKAALALLQSKNCGDLTVGDLAAAISNAIAAAPQFVAGEVTSTAQILIEEIGSAGPENAEDAARRACGVIQRQADQIVSADARIAALSRLLAEAGEVVADAARYLAIDPRGREAELARLNAMVEEIGRAM